MSYTDNPIKDFYSWDYERENSPDRQLGTCEYCSEPVLASDSYYLGKDGEYAHKECVQRAEERIVNFI